MQKHSSIYKGLILLLLAGFTIAHNLSCIALLEDPDAVRETPITPELLIFIAAGAGGFEYGTPQGGGEAGPEGTVLRSNDGLFSVTIPPGAMQDGDTTNFSITRYNLSSESLPTGFLPVSHIYQVTPSYAFQKKVRVTMAFDESEVSANNLETMGTRGFSYSTSSAEENAGRLSGWEAIESEVGSQQVRFETRTFSLFGAGSPVPGNQAPVITGAFYYFKPGCAYLPYRVRARVIEPDGDNVNVYLNNGPASSSTNIISMSREGATDWFSADLFYESMDSNGIQIQVMAVDDEGAATFRPDHGTFLYPDDAANPIYDSEFDADSDDDGLLCAWEVDQGLNDQNPADAVGNTDTDGDSIPDVSDHTPNGETNPAIDTLEVYPEEALLAIGEIIAVGIRASFSGEPRFVHPTISLTGNALNGSPVGAMTGNQFEADYPGVAGVEARINSFTATASIRVLDTLSPENITDLAANSYSHTAIHLEWTAPGNDESHGAASGYQVRMSNAPITSTAECTSAMAVSHSLIPSTAGIQERLEVNGLSPNQDYFFCVLAYDLAGNFNEWVQGSLSARTQPVPDLTAPSAISDLVATASSPSTVDLTWTTVGDDGNTGAASAYEIRKSLSPISNDVECSNANLVPNSLASEPTGTPVVWTVSNLTDGSAYYFCVRAFDEVNNRSSWTGIVSAKTPYGNNPPIADAGQDGTAQTGQTVHLDASQSSDPDAAHCGASSGLYSYNWTFLSLPPTSGLSNADLINSNTLNSQFVPDVSGTYALQFSFTDDAGSCAGDNRTDVDTVSIEISDLTPPGNLQATLLQDGIELTWDPAGVSDGYRIYYSTTSPVNTSDTMVDTSDLSILLTDGFTDDSTYYFAVAATESGDESDLSTEANVYLPQTICTNNIIEFPEQCDDGNAGDWDGCSDCRFQIGFNCDNSSGSTICDAGPYDLGSFGVGDSMSPENGPALNLGEQKHYIMTFTESITLGMDLTASSGNPDLLIGECNESYTNAYEALGNESFVNLPFAPGCYVITVEAQTSLPAGFTIEATVNPP